jgi:uncharacterized membrane protein YeaQ/YmgE (transglycosylase-associated protein family)
MIGILWFLLFGLIVGVVAKWFVPGEAPGGIVGDIIVGVLGSFIGDWLFSVVAHETFLTWTWAGFVSAVLGAIILLYLMRVVSGRRSAG